MVSLAARHNQTLPGIKGEYGYIEQYPRLCKTQGKYENSFLSLNICTMW